MKDYRAYVENDYNSLYHYGIRGQKWGIRRYQNPDGSLTPEGRARYLNPDGSLNERGRRELGRQYLKDRKYAGRVAGGALGTAAAAYHAHSKQISRRFSPEYKHEVDKIRMLHPDKTVLSRSDFMKDGVRKTAKTVEEVRKMQKEGWAEIPSFQEYKRVKDPMVEKLINEFDKKTVTRAKKAVAVALAAGIGATAIGLYLHHKGVQKRKAEVERMLMGSDKSDSSTTKRTKDDWKNMSDKEFRQKYGVSKDKYAKRVAKYRDPYEKAPLDRLGRFLSGKKTGNSQRGFAGDAPSLKDIRTQQNKQGRVPTIKETVERQNSFGRAPSIIPNFVTDNFSKAESMALSRGGDYYVAYDPNLGGYIVRRRGR